MQVTRLLTMALLTSCASTMEPPGGGLDGGRPDGARADGVVVPSGLRVPRERQRGRNPRRHPRRRLHAVTSTRRRDPMKRHHLLLSLVITGLAACGDGDAAPTDAGPTADVGPFADAVIQASDGSVTLAGVSINHSMNRLASMQTGRTPEYSNLTVEAVSVDALAAAGASAAALAGGALDTAACTGMGGCAWSVGGASLAGVTLGLAARLRDNRASGQLWVTTATGFASPEEVTAAARSGSYTNGRAFAVSRDAIDTVIAGLVGLTGEEVMARGFIFGLVYNTYSGSSADGSGQPVVGATVVASRAGMRIVYPNNTFSGTASATASQGAFLAVPEAVGASATTSFTVTPPAGMSQTWDATRTMVVIPGAVYFAPMYAR